jgi:hypothetical protein
MDTGGTSVRSYTASSGLNILPWSNCLCNTKLKQASKILADAITQLGLEPWKWTETMWRSLVMAIKHCQFSLTQGIPRECTSWSWGWVGPCDSSWPINCKDRNDRCHSWAEAKPPSVLFPSNTMTSQGHHGGCLLRQGSWVRVPPEDEQWTYGT